MKRKSKKPKIETEIIGVQLGIHGVKKELTGLVTAYLSKVDHYNWAAYLFREVSDDKAVRSHCGFHKNLDSATGAVVERVRHFEQFGWSTPDEEFVMKRTRGA